METAADTQTGLTCSHPGCLKSFQSRVQLNRHLKTHLNSGQFSCRYCEARLSSRDSLRIHITKHSDAEILKPPTLSDFKCSVCADCFSVRNELVIHLNTSHQLDVHKDYYTFPDFPAFESFLDDIQGARFVNRKGEIILAESQSTYFYVCNRSKESSRTKPCVREERPVRQVNSVKCDFNCLAYISAHKFKDGVVDAEYVDFHTCPGDGNKMRLTRAVKSNIEAQIEQGLSVDRILKNATAKFSNRNTREQAIQVPIGLCITLIHALMRCYR
jgi:hypothetical protein